MFQPAAKAARGEMEDEIVTFEWGVSKDVKTCRANPCQCVFQGLTVHAIGAYQQSGEGDAMHGEIDSFKRSHLDRAVDELVIACGAEGVRPRGIQAAVNLPA